jgi:hypothetical protein
MPAYPEWLPKEGDILLGRFQLQQWLGVGIHGGLFRALDRVFKKEVAVKVFRPEYFRDSFRETNLFRLYRTRAYMHKHLLGVKDIFVTQEHVFLTQAMSTTLNLREALLNRRTEGKPFTKKELVEILSQVCNVLHWVHRIGVHGNLKPENVLFLRDEVRVSDPYFLVGKAEVADPPVAVPSWEHYVAPEQLERESEELRQTDIYSLGLLLGEVLLGAPVKPGLPLSEQGPFFSNDLDELFLKATARDPAARFPDVSSIWGEIRRIFNVPPQSWESGEVAGLIDLEEIEEDVLATEELAEELEAEEPVELAEEPVAVVIPVPAPESVAVPVPEPGPMARPEAEPVPEPGPMARPEAEPVPEPGPTARPEAEPTVEPDLPPPMPQPVAHAAGDTQELGVPELEELPPDLPPLPEVEGRPHHVSHQTMIGLPVPSAPVDEPVEDLEIIDELEEVPLDVLEEGGRSGDTAEFVPPELPDTALPMPPASVLHDADTIVIGAEPAPVEAPRPEKASRKDKKERKRNGQQPAQARPEDARGASPEAARAAAQVAAPAAPRPVAAEPARKAVPHVPVARKEESRGTWAVSVALVGIVVLGAVLAILYWDDVKSVFVAKQPRVVAQAEPARPGPKAAPAGPTGPVAPTPPPAAAPVPAPVAAVVPEVQPAEAVPEAAAAVPEAAPAGPEQGRGVAVAVAAPAPAGTTVPPPGGPMGPAPAPPPGGPTGPVAVAVEPPKPAPPKPEPAKIEPPKPVPPKPEPTKAEPPKPVPPKPEPPKPEPVKVATAEPAKPAGPATCPGGMARLSRKDGAATVSYCIDRNEYPGAGRVPTTSVSWDAAQAACKGQGKRLCTNPEWQLGCGGKYPYGKTYDPNKCNTMTEDDEERPLAAAGANAGCRSGAGLFDMSGNAAEWTEDGTVNGGSSDKDGESATCGKAVKRFKGQGSPFVGFRCCADLQ